MKISLVLVTLVFFAGVVYGQANSPASKTEVSFTAQSIESQGSRVLCRGDVKISTAAVVLRADEADYASDTGELVLRGNVRAKLAPAVKVGSCAGAICAIVIRPPAVEKRTVELPKAGTASN
jgi:hypothetical protein